MITSITPERPEPTVPPSGAVAAHEGPLLSVIVVNWNTRDLLRACLRSIERYLGGVPHETIVVDNASADGSAAMVGAEFPAARLVQNERNEGFGRANNQAMALARGEFLLLLNSDAELCDDGAVRLVERLRENQDFGMAGLRIVYPDGRLQASARRFPSIGRAALTNFWLYRLVPRSRAADLLLGHYWDHDSEREVDWLIGACLLVRRAVFESTRGFDPSIFLYGEEVEWCHRVRQYGWRILYSPVGRVLHLDHQSANQLLGSSGRIDRCLLAEDLLVERWQGRVAGKLLPLVRIAGAFLRLVAFRVRALCAQNDSYGRDVCSEARSVLDHYRRRWSGALRAAA